MLARTFALLLGTLALLGCATGTVTGPAPARFGAAGAGDPGIVAILLPLSGPRGEIALALQHGAELALAAPGSPRLDVRDTAGTPQGAAAAAQAAIAGGAGIILGPLTSAETASVAPVAARAGVPVLAFTNDSAQAQPGVWPLGITPRQQVFRLVAAAQARGKTHFAGLVPEGDFGRAMAAALQEATTAGGLEPPRLQSYAKGRDAITGAARDLADYGTRGGDLQARIKAARAQGDDEGRQQAAELETERGTVPPPSFDALLLADTGEPLTAIAASLAESDVASPAVRILGPVQWADPSSGSKRFPGAWYAAPDQTARAGFAEAYAARFARPPSGIADLAYDAASIARVLSQNGGIGLAGLTQPAGFAGTDGLLALLPDGQVRRALSVFEIGRGGPQMVDPAPQSLAAPGV